MTPCLFLAWKGMVIGFCIAAPVGPIGLLCIRRSIARGPWQGMAAGMGAAVADSVYGLIGAGGFSLLMHWLDEGSVWMTGIGAVFLAYLGVTVWRKPVVLESGEKEGDGRGAWAAFGLTFVLTLMNPITVIAFSGIMAATHLGVSGPVEVGALVGGVFLGSTLWWLILSQMASRLGARLDAKWLRRMDQACGVLLGLMAVGALVRWWRLVF